MAFTHAQPASIAIVAGQLFINTHQGTGSIGHIAEHKLFIKCGWWRQVKILFTGNQAKYAGKKKKGYCG